MTEHEAYDYELIGKTVIQLLEALKPRKKEAEIKEEKEEPPSDEDLVTYLTGLLKKEGKSILISKISSDIPKETRAAITKDGRTMASFFRKYPEVFALAKKSAGRQTVDLAKRTTKRDPSPVKDAERTPHCLRAICKFYSTKEGCKWGDKCHRQHTNPEAKE